jgi:hypothetical protein
MFGMDIPTFFGHFDVTLAINHRVYYKRKGGGGFQVHNVSYEFGLFMGCLCIILIPTCTKHFF